LFSYQREADPRLAFHAVYAAATHNTCVVADETDVYILLLFVADKAIKMCISGKEPRILKQA